MFHFFHLIFHPYEAGKGDALFCLSNIVLRYPVDSPEFKILNKAAGELERALFPNE